MGDFSSEFLVSLETLGQTHLGLAWPVVYNLLKITLIVVPILAAVAYLTLWERKLIGWMHVRLGPNRVGPLGLLQPIADSLKLLTKELIVPTQASKGLYLLAPVMTIMPALAAWAVIPFGPDVVLANINAGLLFLLAILRSMALPVISISAADARSTRSMGSALVWPGRKSLAS